MRSMRIFAASLTMLLLTSCASTPETETKVIDTGCQWTFTIQPTLGEIESMTDGTKRQILTHNKRREKHCE